MTIFEFALAKEAFNRRDERQWKKFELVARCLGWKPPEQVQGMSLEELEKHNAEAEEIWKRIEAKRAAEKVNDGT